MNELDTTPGADRGQAYTLEGIIGAMVVLLAVLFALQSVIVMPTTSGTADRAVQSQIQQEAGDALVVAAKNGDLSATVRNWDPDSEAWIDEGEEDVDGEPAFYGADRPGPDETWTYSTETFAEQSTLGEILEARFTARGWSYNVDLVADGSEGFETTPLVYQGSAPPDAVTASYTVTLYDDEELTSPEGNGIDLETAHVDHEYPIGPNEDASGPTYTVVEVRLTVW